MKKTISMLVCLAVALAAQAFDYKTTVFEQLPTTAQQFVKKHFAHALIATTLEEKQGCEMLFTNGYKMKFTPKGNRKGLKSKRGFVAHQTMPAAISKYVKENHPGSKVTLLEKDRDEYAVNLPDAREIKVDTNCNITDADHDNN